MIADQIGSTQIPVDLVQPKGVVQLGARFVQLDVTDDASVAAAVETIAAEGGLDVLVNNAGVEPAWPATPSPPRRRRRPS